MTSTHFRKKCGFQLVKLQNACLMLCGFGMCCKVFSLCWPPWLGGNVLHLFVLFPEGRSSTSTENVPYLSKLLICVLIWSFSNYSLVLLLTADYFFTKPESAKFAMTSMNLIIARAAGKCVCADKAPLSTHLT